MQVHTYMNRVLGTHRMQDPEHAAPMAVQRLDALGYVIQGDGLYACVYVWSVCMICMCGWMYVCTYVCMYGYKRVCFVQMSCLLMRGWMHLAGHSMRRSVHVYVMCHICKHARLQSQHQHADVWHARVERACAGVYIHTYIPTHIVYITFESFVLDHKPPYTYIYRRIHT